MGLDVIAGGHGPGGLKIKTAPKHRQLKPQRLVDVSELTGGYAANATESPLCRNRSDLLGLRLRVDPRATRCRRQQPPETEKTLPVLLVTGTTVTTPRLSSVPVASALSLLTITDGRAASITPSPRVAVTV